MEMLCSEADRTCSVMYMNFVKLYVPFEAFYLCYYKYCGALHLFRKDAEHCNIYRRLISNE
ncbi:hypothetical protein SAMN05216327_103139 [Dyadobacter sp. SG02]|nr:hypothetical protein SAMN05216327_103139 [Dyadobacter sp. SG02]